MDDKIKQNQNAQPRFNPSLRVLSSMMTEEGLSFYYEKIYRNNKVE